MAKKDGVSIYMCYVLRHHPEDIHLDMDKHGWVSVQQLIDGINNKGKYYMDFNELKSIVDNDSKGRYRFNEDCTRIKACQGHSIEWVEPELIYKEPPKYLYHGTTKEAYELIKESGYIDKMKRHAVHMQEYKDKAWQSAKRWKKEPLLLQIDAYKMYNDGYIFGVSENDVWCVEKVPVEYIVHVIYEKRKNYEE